MDLKEFLDLDNSVIVMPCCGTKNEKICHLKDLNIIFNARQQQIINDTIYTTPYASVKSVIDNYPDENITWYDFVSKSQNISYDIFNMRIAYDMYKNKTYKLVYEAFKNKMYILSAGWGIIRSEFKIPAYNIVYKTGKDNNYRNNSFIAPWKDFNHLLEDYPNKDVNVIFAGGQSYWSAFTKLTTGFNRKMLYNSFKTTPRKEGINCEEFYYNCKAKTNWHYIPLQEIAKLKHEKI